MWIPVWQRTWIALLEKGLPFTYKEVSLRNPSTGLWFPLQEKPQWFTALNPLGKVRVQSLMPRIFQSFFLSVLKDDMAMCQA